MASSCLRFLDHTQRRITVGRTLLDEWSARRRDLYLTTHNKHNRQTSTPPVGLEPTISAGKRPWTYALDCAATETGCCNHTASNFTTKTQIIFFFRLSQLLLSISLSKSYAGYSENAWWEVKLTNLSTCSIIQLMMLSFTKTLKPSYCKIPSQNIDWSFLACVNQMFIAPFRRAGHLSLFWTKEVLIMHSH